MLSTRLPGKVLKPLVGKTVLAHVLGRFSALDSWLKAKLWSQFPAT